MSLNISTFEADVTPKKGDPIEYGSVKNIIDPLSCRGVIIHQDSLPIVIACLDWIGLYNGGYDFWQSALANAAGTTPNRVMVHTVHQHEAPGFDIDEISILSTFGIKHRTISSEFAMVAIKKVCAEIREKIQNPIDINKVGVGKATVDNVASNRQLLSPDGNILCTRSSCVSDPDIRKLPEGLVDDTLRLISFWNDKEPIVGLSFFAVHPQTYYGGGNVTCDFVGLARNRLEEDLKIPILHFNGAAGNITVGKYNDGTSSSRKKLSDRLFNGMKVAWKNTNIQSLTANEFEWRTVPVKLPVASHIDRKNILNYLTAESRPLFEITGQDIKRLPKVALLKMLKESPFFPDADTPNALYTSTQAKRVYSHISQAARDLAWLNRSKLGMCLQVSCIQISNNYILSAPGELFVEYQIAATEMRPNDTVAMAAYSDSGPFYIGTFDSYHRGGYGVGEESRVAPNAEFRLVGAFQDLLNVPDSMDVTMPSDITRNRKYKINPKHY